MSTRPLSPHLQVYRPQITSVLSILHRITGVIIALGAIVISLWIESVARGDPWYGSLSDLLVSPLGKILMIIWTLCTAYHLCNGIRHLAWDIGYGFEIPQVYRTGKLVMVFAIIITAGVWWI
ncbi:MAG: succinate dehydrogenase, cytochrome b556 subunit [Gammaproteobacteria bacterium]|nr:succinate dehydrogenase, cytochrome b556 subunit [Gammaproteobacteria bacterium]